MRELNRDIKLQVIKLFLLGWTFDEIAQRLGIAKGSVVNIINDYREGRLSIPADMTEHADALRRTAVDLRKHQTTVSQLQVYIEIHEKVTEMGVDKDDVIQWLDVSRDIASSVNSDGQFVKYALELARLRSETGLSYDEIIADYKEKNARRDDLNKEIDEKITDLNEIKRQHEEEEKRAREEKVSINKQRQAAQDSLDRRKNEIEAELNEYMKQNKLSWSKVNTVLAIFNREIKKAGLTESDIAQIAGDICSAGTLVTYTRRLEKEKGELLGEIEGLKGVRKGYNTDLVSLKRSNDELKQRNEELNQSNYEVEGKTRELESKLESKREEFRELTIVINNCQHNIYLTELIIEFLSNPELIDYVDLERLVGTMIAIRQKRKGVTPTWKIDDFGNPVCECVVPEVYKTMVYLPKASIEGAREQLASYLFPIVKDKFITRHAHELAMKQTKREHEQAMDRMKTACEMATVNTIAEVLRLVGGGS